MHRTNPANRKTAGPWAEIDLAALCENYALLRAAAPACAAQDGGRDQDDRGRFQRRSMPAQAHVHLKTCVLKTSKEHARHDQA